MSQYAQLADEAVVVDDEYFDRAHDHGAGRRASQRDVDLETIAA
jgi:hypothetical protein